VRDIRRLIVALSRARLGLYVFCRKSLFENHPDCKDAFELLFKRSSVLSLIPSEEYGSINRTKCNISKSKLVHDCVELGEFVHQKTLEKVEQIKSNDQ
jgi:intron-binding protein aquarius